MFENNPAEFFAFIVYCIFINQIILVIMVGNQDTYSFKFGFLLIFVLFSWLSWPVSFWLLLVFLCYCLFYSITYLLQAARKGGYCKVLCTSFEISLQSLNRAIIWVGIGIGIVAVVQAALWSIGQAVDPAKVRRVEEFLFTTYELILGTLNLSTLAVILILLVVVAMITPHSDVVNKFLLVKQGLSRIGFILLGMISFTFFSALDLQQVEPEWRAAECWRVRAVLASITKHQRETLAAAWVANEAHAADTIKKHEFSYFFKHASSIDFPNVTTRSIAHDIAKNAPKVIPENTQTNAARELLPLRVLRYIDGTGDKSMSRMEQPTLAEIRIANQRLSAYELRVSAARTAAIEFANEAFVNMVGNADYALVKTFVEEIVSSLSKSALEKVVPNRIADVVAAQNWVRQHIINKQMRYRWNFSLVSLEMQEDVRNLKEIDTVVSAVMRRYNAEQAWIERRMDSFRFNKPEVKRFRLPPIREIIPRLRF